MLSEHSKPARRQAVLMPAVLALARLAISHTDRMDRYGIHYAEKK